LELAYDSSNNPIAPSSSDKVIFHTREPIFPGDSVPSTLTCFNRCPDYNNLASGSEWGSSSVYKEAIWIDNVSGSTTGYTYSFDNDTSGMVLKDGINEIVFNPSNTNLEWDYLLVNSLRTTQLIGKPWPAIGTAVKYVHGKLVRNYRAFTRGRLERMIGRNSPC